MYTVYWREGYSSFYTEEEQEFETLDECAEYIKMLKTFGEVRDIWTEDEDGDLVDE